uniref:TLC domain-containing protein n=1 Tax=Megaviridae environmental sample TaxID=1737588 RepID=A0A5J6VJ73_9VIRU|nr:MAG: hypothetical protein [Megaviridae environmental sample]
MYKDIVLKLFILHILWNVIKIIPQLNKYSKKTKLNIYRSLLCLTFSGMAIQLSFNNLRDGMINPFLYKHPDFDEICNLFIAYIIYDLYIFLINKESRIDIYIHHIWCLGSFLVSKKYDHCNWLSCLLLINEAISIVTGIDSIAMEENNFKLSAYYKKIRINIIKYIRFPIWITFFLFTLKHSRKLPNILWWNYMITIFLMTILDRYWELKCEKVINKYKKT